MPRKRRGADLSRTTSKCRYVRYIRFQRTEDEIRQQNAVARERMAQRRALIRASQTQEQREAAGETARLETRNRRAYRTDEQRNNLRSASRNGSAGLLATATSSNHQPCEKEERMSNPEGDESSCVTPIQLSDGDTNAVDKENKERQSKNKDVKNVTQNNDSEYCKYSIMKTSNRMQ